MRGGRLGVEARPLVLEANVAGHFRVEVVAHPGIPGVGVRILDVKGAVANVTGIPTCFLLLSVGGARIGHPLVGEENLGDGLDADNELASSGGLEAGGVVEVAWELPRGEHPLHCAAVNENLKAVRLWVGSGTTVDILAAAGITPLMSAAQNGSLDGVRELLRLGANVKARDGEGRSALHHGVTIALRSTEVIEALLAAWADVAAVDGEDRTAADYVLEELEIMRAAEERPHLQAQFEEMLAALRVPLPSAAPAAPDGAALAPEARDRR